MALTNNTKVAILKNLLGWNEHGIAPKCYIGLSTTEPVAATGENFYEPLRGEGGIGDTGYQRYCLGQYEIAELSAAMKIDEDGKAYNKEMIHFNEAKVAYPAAVTHFGLFTTADTASTEKPFLTGALNSSVSVGAGQIAIFSASTSWVDGNLKFSIDEPVAGE